jgi:hypothetical protein
LKDWVAAQDQVFANCSGDATIPEDFKSPACRSSVGISTDEPLPSNSSIFKNRRTYVFNPRSWSPEAFARIAQEVQKR